MNLIEKILNRYHGGDLHDSSTCPICMHFCSFCDGYDGHTDWCPRRHDGEPPTQASTRQEHP